MHILFLFKNGVTIFFSTQGIKWLHSFEANFGQAVSCILFNYAAAEMQLIALESGVKKSVCWDELFLDV